MKRKVANPYRAFRQLERKLFLGVPERPESFWERDGNNEMRGRITGRSLLSDATLSVSLAGARTIATITYRPQTGEVLVERAPEPKTISAKSTRSAADRGGAAKRSAS